MDAASEMSVRELADAAGVSPSTIVRLCHKVGRRGYKDFRSGILVEVVTKERSAVASLSGVDKGDCTEAILQKVTDRNISSLSLTVRLLDPVSVEAVVSLMGSSKLHRSCLALEHLFLLLKTYSSNCFVLGCRVFAAMTCTRRECMPRTLLPVTLPLL
jgi:DNA-binding MurR/RpiR family transcriptional regulator